MSSPPPTRLTRRSAWAIGLKLPDVEEGTTYGTAALKVRGQVMVCVPTHRSAEPHSLIVRVDPGQRPDLIAEAPDVYYLPDHYRNYPFVLIRLTRITRDALEALLHEAWRLTSERAVRSKARRVKSGRGRRSGGSPRTPRH